MAIGFVFGSAGSGKSSYLRDYLLREAALHPKRTYFYFVPDQYTFAAQKELVRSSPGKAIVNIEAISFERFARRVFNELGYGLPDVLDDAGKALLLSKAAGQIRDELSVFSTSIDRPGTIDELKSFFSELRQYDVSPERLEEALSEPGLSLSFGKKAKDIVLLYKAFRQELEGRYITSEEIITRLLSVIERSQMVSDSSFVFDGYTGFTPLQYLLIEKLCCMSQTLLFSFTIGDEVSLSGSFSEEELFSLSKKTVSRLTSIAEKTGAGLIDPVRLTGEKRFSEGGRLSHLNRYLFRAEKRTFVPAGKEEDEVRIFSLRDPREELAFACSTILSEVRTKGMRYSDFAILCADLSEYEYIIPEAFEAYSIPYFFDSEKSFSYNPLLEFIDSAIRIISGGFRYEDVMHFLRTGLSGVGDIDLFDSYLFSTGLSGIRRYSSAFLLKPQDFSDDDVARVNEVREALMERLKPFHSALKKKGVTVRECAAALYILMDSCDAEAKLIERSQELLKADDLIRAEEYEKIFSLVIGCLDRTVELLGDQETDPDKFSSTLSVSMSELLTGVLPASNDCVVVGDLERTRLDHISTLFLIGAHDGAIPRSLSGGGVISETEREELLSTSLELAPSGRQKAFIQRFYLYLALTKPSKALYITFPETDLSGAGVRASYLIRETEALFSDCIRQELTETPLLDAAVSPSTAEERVSSLLSECVRGDELSPEKKDGLIILLHYLKEKDRKRYDNVLSAAFFSYSPEAVEEAVLARAHGDALRGSVTSLQTYFECPYRYFLRYEAGLSERKSYALDSADIGSLYHEVLKTFFTRAMERELLNSSAPEDMIEKTFSESFLDELSKLEKAQLLDDPFEKHAVENIRATIGETAGAVLFQLRRGQYVPYAFEEAFKNRTAMPSDDGAAALLLRGKIDRIDVFPAGDELFLRIVDYKSGQKGIDYTDLFYGLDMQLFSYLDEAMKLVAKKHKGNQRIVPGGLMYCHIGNPMTDVPLLTGDEELLKERMTAYKMTGAINSDERNIRATDSVIFDGNSDDIYGKSSPVFPIRLKTDGSLSSLGSDARLSTAELTALTEFAGKKEAQAAQQISKGNFPARPYIKYFDKTLEGMPKNGCTYCPYISVCGFDTALDGYCYERLSKKSLSDCSGEDTAGPEGDIE